MAEPTDILDDAIREYVKTRFPESYVTEWFMVCATAEPDADARNGYIHAGSDLPRHHVYGLLDVARELVDGSSYLVSIQEDDEDDE